MDYWRRSWVNPSRWTMPNLIAKWAINNSNMATLDRYPPEIFVATLDLKTRIRWVMSHARVLSSDGNNRMIWRIEYWVIIFQKNRINNRFFFRFFSRLQLKWVQKKNKKKNVLYVWFCWYDVTLDRGGLLMTSLIVFKFSVKWRGWVGTPQKITNGGQNLRR